MLTNFSNAGTIFAIVTGTMLGTYQIDQRYVDVDEVESTYQTKLASDKYMASAMMFQTQTTATLLDIRARELHRRYEMATNEEVKKEIQRDLKKTSDDMTELASNFSTYYDVSMRQ